MATSGRSLSRKQVYEIVSKAIDSTGLVKRRKGPHLQRHTGATLRALRGDGIEKLRVWLDHTSYTMSQRYVHAAEHLRQETVRDEILKNKDQYIKTR
jgi:site-specific recombinase XerD